MGESWVGIIGLVWSVDLLLLRMHNVSIYCEFESRRVVPVGVGACESVTDDYDAVGSVVLNRPLITAFGSCVSLYFLALVSRIGLYLWEVPVPLLFGERLIGGPGGDGCVWGVMIF